MTQSPCLCSGGSFSHSRFTLPVCHSRAHPRLAAACPVCASLVGSGRRAGRAAGGPRRPAAHSCLPQVWQHCDCMGVHADVEHYLCERCDPRPVDRVSRAPRPRSRRPALSPSAPPPASVPQRYAECRAPTFPLSGAVRGTMKHPHGPPGPSAFGREEHRAQSRAASREGGRLCGPRDSAGFYLGSALCPVVSGMSPLSRLSPSRQHCPSGQLRDTVPFTHCTRPLGAQSDHTARVVTCSPGHSACPFCPLPSPSQVLKARCFFVFFTPVVSA